MKKPTIETILRVSEINQLGLCHDDGVYLTINQELIKCTEPQDVFDDIKRQLIAGGCEFICIEYTHAE